MASNQVPDLTENLGKGFGFASKIKSASVAKKNQQLLGGLRRRALGVGGGDAEDQKRAATELTALNPKAAAQLFASYQKLDTPAQKKLRIDNNRMARDGAFLQGVPDSEFPQALQGMIQQATQQKDQALVQKLTALAQLPIEEARPQINAAVSQARTVEATIASNEKRIKELADAKFKKGESTFKRTDQIRARVDVMSKAFVGRRDSMTGLRASLQGAIAGNKASQVAVVFQFMKALDPTSVVRESEFHLVATSTAGYGARVMNWMEKVNAGLVLSPDQIRQIASEAEANFSKHQKAQEVGLKKFKRQAKSEELDWNQIWDAGEGKPISTPTPNQDAYNLLMRDPSDKNKKFFEKTYGFVPEIMKQKSKANQQVGRKR